MPKHVVVVTTAHKLSDSQKSVVKTLITKKLGSGFEIKEVVDTSVVGGVRITLGSQNFDATISGTLEKIDSLLEAVEVTSAIPLTTTQRKLIHDGLKQKMGKSLEMVEIVDPTVIAGVRVRLGSREFDGTYQKQLEKLATTLTSEL
ncbi:F0F1 ATP synthase subunit delta [Candidatus Woesebacteria bacterium]|nr:F0F1 ATP synthase subunit delta [Candidatus Woesebacteria bacterium]